MRTSTSIWLLALWILVTSAQGGTIFTETYTHVGHTQDLNSNLAARTFGTVTVTNYNSGGSAWQTQIRDDPSGETLSLAPRNGPGSPRVWAGPDYDFQADVGTEYTIIFDVNPSSYSTAWSAVTFGVNAANQGANISDNHGGMSLSLNDSGDWQLFDGSDASPAAVASGTAAGPDFRSIRLKVTDSGAATNIELAIDSVVQTSYSYTGSFAANYMSFSAFTTNSATHSGANFDDFNILPASPYVWHDPYNGNDPDINLGIYDRTSGEVLVKSYNEAGASWQTQLWATGTLLLGPNAAAGLSKVWAGPDHDFLPELGQGYSRYQITFDVDPHDDAAVWAAFTFGTDAANQGNWPSLDHGGISLLLREDDSWVIHDGTDGLAAGAASGFHAAASGQRNVRLEVEDTGTSVVIWLWINGDFQTSYTFANSFAGNYMALVAFTGQPATQSSQYDNFTLGPIPPRTVFRFR